jgi:hypothetical protein
MPGKRFQLFGKDSDDKRIAYAVKLTKKAIALQLLGDLPPGDQSIEEYVKKGLDEYDASKKFWRGDQK